MKRFIRPIILKGIGKIYPPIQYDESSRYYDEDEKNKSEKIKKEKNDEKNGSTENENYKNLEKRGRNCSL